MSSERQTADGVTVLSKRSQRAECVGVPDDQLLVISSSRNEFSRRRYRHGQNVPSMTLTLSISADFSQSFDKFQIFRLFAPRVGPTPAVTV